MISAAMEAHTATIERTSSARNQPRFDRPCRSVAIVMATARQSAVVKAIRRPVGQRESMTFRLPEGPCDHDSLDLVGALVDLRDLGVAHVALDRVLVDEAVAAEHLDGLDAHPHRRVG